MAEVWVPGPLHPDLFDGETPIMMKVQGRLFEVKVSWSETWRDNRILNIFANSQAQAETIAIEVAGDEFADEEADDFEIDNINEIEGKPTGEQLEWLNKYGACECAKAAA